MISHASKNTSVLFLVLITLALLAYGCDFGNDSENKPPVHIDSSLFDSTKIKEGTGKKHLAEIDTSLKDTSTQAQLCAAIMKLPELKKEAFLIDSLSKGKRLLTAVLNDKPMESESLFNVQVIEKEGNMVKPRFDFYIHKDTREIKIYDAGEDRLISLDEWRKINQ